MKELERDERISAAIRSMEMKNTPDDFDKGMAWDRLNQKLGQHKTKVVRFSYYRIAAGLLLVLLPTSAYFLFKEQRITPEGMEGTIGANKLMAAQPVHPEVVTIPLQGVAQESTTNLPVVAIKHNNRKKLSRKNKATADKRLPINTNKNSEMGLMATTMISTPCLNTSPSRYMFN